MRECAAADLAAARALFDAEVAGGNPYASRARDRLDAVADDGEYQAHVAERDGAIVGVVVHGLVAGASGAGAVHAVAVHPAHRRRGVGQALLDAATAALRARHARLAVVELPDDPPRFGALAEALRVGGFAESARVADFYRDGVALAFFARRLP